MPKTLISEAVIQDVILAGKKKLEIPKGAIVTPLAATIASQHGIEIVEGSPKEKPAVSRGPRPTSAPADSSKDTQGNIVAFGSDHGGYQLKQQLIKFAESLGYKALDLGTNDEQPCDYPDFAYAVAHAVSCGQAWRGVMIDGAGIGSCVVANKVPGVKAACCHNEFVARNAREHNDTNVLTLGSRVTGSEVCKEILRIWLETWFAGGRHKSRVDKIDEVERRFVRQ